MATLFGDAGMQPLHGLETDCDIARSAQEIEESPGQPLMCRETNCWHMSDPLMGGPDALRWDLNGARRFREV